MDAESAYLFQHALMRDTAYGLQLPTVRAHLHALILQIMEELHGGAPPAVKFEVGEDLHAEPHPLDAFAAEMAEHALRGQSMTGNLADLRRSQEHYLLRAAWRAKKDFRTDDALSLWLMLGDLANAAGDTMRSAAYRCQAADAATQSGKAELGGHEAAARCFKGAIELLREIGDADVLAEKSAEMVSACTKAGVAPFA